MIDTRKPPPKSVLKDTDFFFEYSVNEADAYFYQELIVFYFKLQIQVDCFLILIPDRTFLIVFIC